MVTDALAGTAPSLAVFRVPRSVLKLSDYWTARFLSAVWFQNQPCCLLSACPTLWAQCDLPTIAVRITRKIQSTYLFNTGIRGGPQYPVHFLCRLGQPFVGALP